MTHTMYGNKVFYILDPDKIKRGAFNVRFYKNKIDLKGYCDTHTPTCDYINAIKDMSDGVNTFATVDSYDCSSLKPLFAPNAFKANGNKINNYLSGLLPTKDGCTRGGRRNGHLRSPKTTHGPNRNHWRPTGGRQ